MTKSPNLTICPPKQFVSHRVLGIKMPLAKWPAWWKRGTTRECFLIYNYAIKIPSLHGRWRHFINGIDANLQEAEFRECEWPEICPVIFSFIGLINVMHRARPLSEQEWEAFDFESFVTRGDGYAEENLKSWHGNARMGGGPDALVVPAENKITSFGILDGRIVAIDYGN